MSDLPEVKQEQILKVVNKKLQDDNSNLMNQVATMELLATSLRIERDTYRDELTKLRSEEKSKQEVLQPDLVINPED